MLFSFFFSCSFIIFLEEKKNSKNYLLLIAHLREQNSVHSTNIQSRSKRSHLLPNFKNCDIFEFQCAMKVLSRPIERARTSATTTEKKGLDRNIQFAVLVKQASWLRKKPQSRKSAVIIVESAAMTIVYRIRKLNYECGKKTVITCRASEKCTLTFHVKQLSFLFLLHEVRARAQR